MSASQTRNQVPYSLSQTITPSVSKWEFITMEFAVPFLETKNGTSGIFDVLYNLFKPMIRLPILNIYAVRFTSNTEYILEQQCNAKKGSTRARKHLQKKKFLRAGRESGTRGSS